MAGQSHAARSVQLEWRRRYAAASPAGHNAANGCDCLRQHSFYNAIDDYVGLAERNLHNGFDIRAIDLDDGSVSVVHEDAHWERHTLDADANFVAPDGTCNKLNRLIKTTDAHGGKTSYAYTETCVVAAAIDAMGGVERMGYDKMGRMASHSTPMENAQRFVYDGIGRLTKAIGPKGSEASMSMTQWRTDNKHNKHNKHNSLNQLTRRIEDGKDNYTYGYDRRGNQAKEVYNKNLSVVHKDYVLDYTSPLHDVIMEKEISLWLKTIKSFKLFLKRRLSQMNLNFSNQFLI